MARMLTAWITNPFSGPVGGRDEWWGAGVKVQMSTVSPPLPLAHGETDSRPLGNVVVRRLWL